VFEVEAPGRPTTYLRRSDVSECVLCGIVDGTVRAKVLYEDDLVVCLDLPRVHPVRLAPVHFWWSPESTSRQHGRST
jgi:hypothetical protein